LVYLTCNNNYSIIFVIIVEIFVFGAWKEGMERGKIKEANKVR
jgi:hypothetical protein